MKAMLILMLALTSFAHGSASLSRTPGHIASDGHAVEAEDDEWEDDEWEDDEWEDDDELGIDAAIGLHKRHLGGEPLCPPAESVELTQTTGEAMLERVVKKCGGHPAVLVFSCGTRPRGAHHATQCVDWAKHHGFTYYLANYAQVHTDEPKETQTPAEVMKDFFAKHRSNTVIMYTGHGRRMDGAWGCEMPYGRHETIEPATVKSVAQEAGADPPTVVTGSCFGGWWLKDFDGISASRPQHKSYAQFFSWLFDHGPLPDGRGRAGQYPMCRGIPT